MMNKLKDLSKSLADCLNEHWIWKTIILFLPSIYLPVIVKYAGENLHLSVKNGKLTVAGIVTTVLVYGGVFVMNVLSSYKSKRDKEEDEKKELAYKKELASYADTLAVYSRLLDVIGNICDNKLQSIYGYITSSIQDGEFRKPFNETVYPERQLRIIAKELKFCLSEITIPPISQIGISMAYEFPRVSSVLKWVDQQETLQCMKLSQLKRNKDTAFYKIYSGQSNFLFFNDKEAAEKEGNYVFDKRDSRYHNIGSIICDEIALEDEHGKIARIILSISTYGYKFTDSSDENVLSNMSDMIEEVILQQFEKRIQIELGLLFVKHQYNKKKS